MKLYFWALTCLLIFSCKSQYPDAEKSTSQPLNLTTKIPAQPNTWMVNRDDKSSKTPSEESKAWTDVNQVMHTYFKTDKAGILHLGLNASVPNGITKLKVTLGGEVSTIELSNTEVQTIQIGEFEVSKGYQMIKIEALETSGTVIANIKEILIGGPATKGKVYYIKDDVYFGRRGPSVHLSYELPKEKKVTWFYNEINVPEGEDVIGSYYMANGFKDGYFGIQVNSETERRILFSVWSPFDTQDPKEIPEDHKIILRGKGEGVTTGEFGNEGSGGQSYKVYNWKPNTSYRFLLKGEPAENNSTDYTAYFYAPEEGKWNLIASFRRPQGSRHLQNLYSFLENFVTATGHISRQANYNNQWVYTEDQEWVELTTAKFTADATARKESRMDYAGGVSGHQFFMKNCGFFDDTTAMGSTFTRKANGKAPQIDFSALELPKK
ncbi:DUF3472 domain-containing protein [Gelidibacter salicanalis]|uniref:DUF3472 domain-containing protein n=1 Tax=Gelidibacter salicanalis TaxID=291193 RepID=A0A5C7ANF3_9FLAO|nr:DUF3472 domain-containing protein [Gelidibacter salicanalis]TXE09153.1 DUF3472 domain-containing protein [Gelidibacter salicanalis]